MLQGYLAKGVTVCNNLPVQWSDINFPLFYKKSEKNHDISWESNLVMVFVFLLQVPAYLQ
jgi:hypothetical protein